MKLIYNTDATPKQMGYGQTLLFALQQLLAILAATILVPMIVNPAEMTVSAALFGAGVGTLVYQLFTKFRSPVFLGSSFAFLSSMGAAFAGAATVALGFLGLIIGKIGFGIGALVFFIGLGKWFIARQAGPQGNNSQFNNPGNFNNPSNTQNYDKETDAL